MHFVLVDVKPHMCQKSAGDYNNRVIMPLKLIKLSIAAIKKRKLPIKCFGIHYCNNLVEVILAILHKIPGKLLEINCSKNNFSSYQLPER